VSMTGADTSGVTVALTLNSSAGLNFPAALNARSVVTGAATMTGA